MPSSKTYRGRVVKETFARGSKSERQAVMLDTGHERLVLRQRGGHPFHDPVLEELVGHVIQGKGLREGYTLILDEWMDVGGKEES